jgi:pimeloyl-ACP methyl ester carboxylesterase
MARVELRSAMVPFLHGRDVIHYIYLSPGMFGFTRLASYDYFSHVERALEARFRKAGLAVETHVSDVLPTASVRRRALRLAELIERTATGDGPIHLLGHSTGGLDARLVASPGAQLSKSAEAAPWLPRLRSITTMNTPHYGTPLASFFATAKGQQALYALSAFTVIGLSLGQRPLAIAKVIMSMIGRTDDALGLTLPGLDRSVASLLGLVDDARSPAVRSYLKAIREDQGAMLQLSPEAMDLVLAGFEDRPGVWYQSTASMSPAASYKTWLRTLGHPVHSLSLSLFSALHAITASHDHHYPCARPLADRATNALDATEVTLAKSLGESPGLQDNDGCVPIRSQLWGTLVWAGLGDHLDVLGHYRDDTPDTRIELRHHDWLTSGSQFNDASFESLMDAIATGMMNSAKISKKAQ